MATMILKESKAEVKSESRVKKRMREGGEVQTKTEIVIEFDVESFVLSR
jgi:hypothetical protein